jgi:glutaredoxin-like YruB-family protein
MEKQITIYSTPTCHFCQLAKEYLNEKNVPFTDFNVAADAEKRQEMIQMTGQMGVPVIRVGDDVMVGFNQEKLAELVGA